MTTVTTATPTDYAVPTTPGPGEPLYRTLARMPLVWVAVLVPGAFIVFLTFLTPSL